MLHLTEIDRLTILTLDDRDFVPAICPPLPGQFASKIGVVNRINFLVIPLRSNNKLKYGIGKGKNFLKEYCFLKMLFYF
jgi:hypothetical protein